MEKKKTYVGQSVVKRDAMALMTGKPVYTDDIAPKDCLIVKVLRSPYAHAWIDPRSGLPWPDRPIRSPAPMIV